MASSSSSKLLSRISRKAAAVANYFLLRGVIVDPAANYSPNYPLLRGVKMINGAGAPRTMSSNVVSGISSSPLLMLPFEKINNTTTVFKFYSLAQDKVLDFVSTNERVNHDRIEVVSSSHGWLTLFNPDNCDLFLFNPLSDRHITLPPIHNLPIHPKNLEFGYECVTKVITSCSPEDKDCRVMMSFGPHRRLAFCSPTSSSTAEWIPIGVPYYENDHNTDLMPRSYQDFVYSTRQKVFYCFAKYAPSLKYDEFEAWNLQDTEAPMVHEIYPYVDQENYPWPVQSQEDIKLKRVCKFLISLVVAEESGDVFWVRRQVMPRVAPDGSYVNHDFEDYHYRATFGKHPYKTLGFDVHKYDPKKCALVYMDGTLDGLALFIGNNHSFAISPAKSDFPELKPNSIYFTDVPDLIPPKWQCRPFGGHDLGIFNYEGKTISKCYYDRQKLKRIIPAPMWFTPTSTPTLGGV